jgi:hypothetical protein
MDVIRLYMGWMSYGFTMPVMGKTVQKIIYEMYENGVERREMHMLLCI